MNQRNSVGFVIERKNVYDHIPMNFEGILNRFLPVKFSFHARLEFWTSSGVREPRASRLPKTSPTSWRFGTERFKRGHHCAEILQSLGQLYALSLYFFQSGFEGHFEFLWIREEKKRRIRKLFRSFVDFSYTKCIEMMFFWFFPNWTWDNCSNFFLLESKSNCVWFQNY